MRALVIGLAVTGAAVARHLLDLGADVVSVDDRVDPATRSRARELGIVLVEAPAPGLLKEMAAGADLVVVSPGVPASHPIFMMDAPVVSELELAGRAARAMGLRLIAITGTNGKTTVTTLVAEILNASGVEAVAAGNIGKPLIEALTIRSGVIVVEASSFQLAMTEQFRPQVATWLNVSEDHLDWHPSMAHYVSAKARIWANQGAGDVAVANWDDPVVRVHVGLAEAETKVTFGSRRAVSHCHYHESDGYLWTPGGERIIAISELWRAFPHDRSNALAASATALACGGTLEACGAVLAAFGGLAHRLELVTHDRGVRWYDDSKATTPASVLAAIAGFDSVVLIAGGRNKGLDLAVLADAKQRLRAVVAMGEAAEELEAAMRRSRGPSIPVLRAGSMHEAVRLAGSVAQRGDVVLLSPGCSSFDWYGSYAERGEHFAELVRAQEAK